MADKKEFPSEAWLAEFVELSEKQRASGEWVDISVDGKPVLEKTLRDAGILPPLEES